MATILITNDDGVGSKGLDVLANVVSDLGEVWVVAPEAESSAVGHGLTPVSYTHLTLPTKA